MYVSVCVHTVRWGSDVSVNEYMYGENAPHLDCDLCVLLRGFLQVGEGVFENDYLCI